MVQIKDKPKPPPIPIAAKFSAPNRKSFRKTLQGLIPVTPKSPKYPDGLVRAKSPISPASIEKGPIIRASFVPLECPKRGGGRGSGLRRRTLILLWVLGIVLILGLSLGLGLGLGMKGLQQSEDTPAAATTTAATNATSPAVTSISATNTSSTTLISSTVTATTSATASATSDPVVGKVVKVQQFDQPAFAVPPNAATTTYTVTGPTATSGTGFVDCPSSHGQEYKVGEKTFKKLCYTDFPGPGVLNLDSITVNSLEHCIDACASYTGSKGSCAAVSYSANISKAYPQQHANCWLKDKSGVAQPGVWDQSGAVLVQ